MPISHRITRHGAALLCFALLAFIGLYPILFNSGVRVAGYDYYNTNWSMWWIRHAFTTPGQNVYETSYLMAPSINNLAYHALAIPWYPLWAVLEPIIGTLTATNVIIFVGCVLNGYLFFVFLRSEGVSPALALIGGAALQLSPVVRYFYYNAHINLMDWFLIPIHLLLWKQIVAEVGAQRLRRAIGWALVLGIALWVLILTDLQYPIFLALILVPYGLYTLWLSKHRVQRLQIILIGVLAVTIGLALAWVAGPLPYMLSFSGTLAPGAVEERPGIPFPGGYLSLYDVWWNWNTPTLGGFVTIVMLLSLAVSLSPLRMMRGSEMPRDRWLWFVVLLPPLILSMGPTLTIGNIAIPLPYRWLFDLTHGNFKMPWRLAPAYVIAAMIFAGKTWTPLFRQMSRVRYAKPLIFAALFVIFSIDIRIFQGGPLDATLYPYDFYQAMGREQGKPYDDYVVLEVPTGAGSGETLIGDPRVIAFEYYGMTHGKRMVNGFISRAPIDHFWSMRTDDPLLSWLGQRRPLDPKLVEPELKRIISAWPVGYIVVHEDYIGLDGPINQEILGYLNTLPDLVCPVYVEHNAVVYRTVWHPDGCPPRTPPEIAPQVYNIDLGTPGDEKFIGWGWHRQETLPGITVRWAGEYPQAKLYADVPPGDYEITLSAQAFHRERQLTVQVNGVAVGSGSIPVDGLKTLTFKVPASAIGTGKQVTVTLAYDSTESAADLGLSADPRQLSIMVDWVRFTRQP